jgi:hypothetical protein
VIAVTLLWLMAAGGQGPACGPDAAQWMADGAARAAGLDLTGAASRFEQASEAGCPDARLPALYLRGLLDAQAAATAPGGDASTSVLVTIDTISQVSGGQPGPAEIARLVLTAALAAAEDERGTMDLFLRQATDMAALQAAAGQPGAPVVSAFEAAGELWLEAGAFADAHAAFTRAADVVGRTPRVVAGLALSAMRLGDRAAACREIRGLLTWWGDREAPPAAVTEARAWLRAPGCG